MPRFSAMTSPLRVCIVSGYQQGARSYAGNLSKALSSLGHDVLWVCDPFWTAPEVTPQQPRIEVLHVNRSKFEYHPLSYLPVRSLRVRRLQHEILTTFRPDILHAIDPTGALLSRRHVPLVATIHHPAAIDLRIPNEFDSKMTTSLDYLALLSHNAAERLQGKRSDLVVTVSKWSRDALGRFYGLPPGKLSVVRNGLDTSSLKKVKNANSPQGEGEDGDVTILHVGRNSPRKRVAFLMRAFHEAHSSLPSLRLRIIGADDASLRGLASRLGISNAVSFSPFLAQDRLYQEMCKSHVFATASAAEGFSYVTLEAMATGIPVVVPNNSAFPELVTNGAEGVLFDSESPKEMATCLRTLAEDGPKRREMGLRGQETAQAHYKLDSFGKGMEEVYELALSSHGQ